MRADPTNEHPRHDRRKQSGLDRTNLQQARVGHVFHPLAFFVIPAFALLPLTYVIAKLNPFTAPNFDLAGPVALGAFGISASASTLGLPVIAVAMIFLLAWRSGVSWRQRTGESLAIAFVLVMLLGGGAYVNEHVIKPRFRVPRPNIVELANTSGASALRVSERAFYDLPSKALRSEHLSAILHHPDFKKVHLCECVREHWIEETGYSFPSGHSFAAMMFATFFLAMGLTFLSGRRLWAFYLLMPWAVLVCYSRLILRVHSPTDITVGGLEGIGLGIAAFLLVRVGKNKR